MKKIESKNDLVNVAVKECIKELYKNAYPKTTFNKALKEFKESSDELKEEYPMYERYYVSQETYEEIRDYFLDIYNLNDSFSEATDLIIDRLENGIGDIKKLNEVVDEDSAEKCINLIKEINDNKRQNFWTQSFLFNVMNYAPTSNIDVVNKYWRKNKK